MSRKLTPLSLDLAFLALVFHWAGGQASIAGRALGPRLEWGAAALLSVALAAWACQPTAEGARGAVLARLERSALALLSWPALVELTHSPLHRKRVVLVGALAAAYVLVAAPLLHRRMRRAGGRVPLVAAAALLGALALLGLPPLFEALRSEASPARYDIEPSWNLLLISVDTTRADFLGCYGQDLPTSPHIDGLANEGVLFEQVVAQAPHTHSSMASLLTSTYPIEHRSVVRTPRLRHELETLAEHLWRSGYQTAAYLDNPWLKREFGFDQGYETFTEESSTGLALEWLAEHGREPFFLHVHYLHPHGPYDPQEPWISEFDPGYEGEWRHVDNEFLDRCELPGTADLSERDLQHFRALYAAEIRRMDEEIGRILEGVAELGLDERTLIVFVADHGEELLDHGGLNHGHTLFEELLHVPLILRWPGHLSGGIRVSSTVQLVDVVPTLLELLALPPLESARGSSLVPLVQVTEAGGEPPPPRLALSQRYHKLQRHLLSAREGRWKLHLLLTPIGPDLLNDWSVIEPEGRDFLWSNDRRLYDLETDPGETVDVSRQHPDVVHRILLEVQRWRSDNDPGIPSAAAGVDVQGLSAATLQRLRDLGYVGEVEQLENPGGH